MEIQKGQGTHYGHPAGSGHGWKETQVSRLPSQRPSPDLAACLGDYGFLSVI